MVVDQSVGSLVEVRRRAQVVKAERRLGNRLVTRDVARELAELDREVGINVLVRPVLGRARLVEESEAGGLLRREIVRGEFQGAPVEVPGSALAGRGDVFLVESKVFSRELRTLASQRPGGSELGVRGVVRVERESPLVRRVRRAEELRDEGIGRAVRGLVSGERGLVVAESSVVEFGRGGVGGRRVGRLLEVESFVPVQLSGERGLVRSGRRGGARGGGRRRIGFVQKRVEGGVDPLVELEALGKFSREKGDFFVLDPGSGEFVLRRHTRFRRFQFGLGGIPGRESVSVGVLPESAETQLNLPRELARAFKKTRKGERFLASQGVLRLILCENRGVLWMGVFLSLRLMLVVG